MPQKRSVEILLESFSLAERKRFALFLSSTYHNNTHKRTEKLFASLSKHVLGKATLTKEIRTILYEESYPERARKAGELDDKEDRALSNLKKQLKKLAYEFLTIEALSTNPATKKELLNTKLLEQKQYTFLKESIDHTKKKLETQQKKGIDYYKDTFQNEQAYMLYLYEYEDLLHKKNIEKLRATLNNLLTNSDSYYLLNKLKLYSTILSINKAYDIQSMEAIQPLLNLPENATNPLIILYRKAIELMKTPDETTCNLFVHWVTKKYVSDIPKAYLLDFHHVILNFYFKQIRAGKTKYYTNIFKVYQSMDTLDILAENGWIGETKLKNIVAASCREKEFVWATEMVKKYAPLIKKEKQEEVKCLNLGAIQFYQGHYDEAIKYIAKAEKLNVACDIDRKMLLLKALYETSTQYDERLRTRFRSTENFIKKNQTLPNKKSYMNFVNMLIDVYRIKYQQGRKKLASVKSALNEMEAISDKKWLLEKIKDIEKPNK